MPGVWLAALFHQVVWMLPKWDEKHAGKLPGSRVTSGSAFWNQIVRL